MKSQEDKQQDRMQQSVLLMEKKSQLQSAEESLRVAKEALKNIEATGCDMGNDEGYADRAKADIQEAEARLKSARDEYNNTRLSYSHRFYAVKNKKGEAEIVFDIVSILDILKELGFYRYDDETNDGKSVYVRIHDGKIQQIHETKVIRDAFVDYIHSLENWERETEDDMRVTVTPDMIYRKLLGSINYYLGEDKLERLRPDEPITIMHDTYSTKYFYYRNCIVQVSAEGVSTFEYSRLQEEIVKREKVTGEKNGRYIWQSSIMDRDYNADAAGGDFSMFCQLICGMKDFEKKTETQQKQSAERYYSLQSILGYLMHGNFECNLKAILFTDANIGGDGRQNGGTGKGILGKALSAIMNRRDSDRKYISEAGKTFKTDDERRYSNGDLSTQLIHVEDIRKNFDFESFYNDVTEYVPIRKMNVDKIMIKSKIMLSSNTPIDVITTGNAVKRRLIIFELDNYFNAKHTPIDEFGHRFFESKWTRDDWQEFDCFMVECSYYYMKNKDRKNESGELIEIKEPPMINYKRQLLVKELPEQFLDWFEDKIKPDVDKMVYVELKKKELYDEFRGKYEEYANSQLYARAFTKWCKFYLEVMGIPSAEKRSTDDIFILYPNLSDPKIKVIFCK